MIISLSVFIYTSVSYNLSKKAEIDRIDEVLRSTAYGALNIAGESFHDRITDSQSITFSEYENICDVLTRYANEVNALYIYTYVEYNGKIHFTASNTLENEQLSPFFFDYDDPEISNIETMMKPLKTKEIQYNDISDTNGDVRTVLIPITTKAGKTFVVGTDFSTTYITERLNKIFIEYIFIGVGIFIFALIISYILVSKLSKPLNELTNYTHELVTNDYKLSENSEKAVTSFSQKFKDEVGKLSEAFLIMQQSLQKYIVDLKDTTAAKEKIQSELRVAHNIQMAMLPKKIPHRPEFKIHSFMQPAKEVGGDLYDFFFIEDDYLCFVIGDVSGKGVPAALFMAVTKTIIKATAMNSLKPVAQILTEVNNELSRDNDAAMFCTLFCGIMHIPTGKINYSSAGHNPPVLIRKGAKPEYLINKNKNIALGVWEEFEFQNEELTLNNGDKLFLYTDGVTEAVNPALQLYSEPRLLELSEKIQHENIDSFINKTMEDILAFADGAEQADDITMQMIEYLK